MVVLLLAVGLWAAFFRDTGGEPDPPIAIEPTGEPTLAAPTDEPLPTDESPTEAAPTDEPAVDPTATAEPLPEGPVGAVDSIEGDVVVIAPDGQESLVDENTIIANGSRLVTGADSQITFTLEDQSIIQLDENSDLGIQNIAADPEDPTQETLFKLDLGNVLLRQPEIGNALSVVDLNEDLLATLQVDNSVAQIRGSMSRRLLQGSSDVGVMAVLVQEDLARISCFVGDCFLEDRQPLPTGTEIVITLGGVVVSEESITEESNSYQRWQETCGDCLQPADPPVVEPTEVPPTAVPTATLVPEPTPTEQPAETELSVRISSIGLDNGTYIINYETFGYTEQLPGQHVHFYFDTVSEANAGSPGSGPWKLYGGPRPFTGYSEGERPGGASSMCARVANADHSIIYGSGNCYPLP